MLYKPKFCSPSMTADQKCFVYNADNKYTFSCICDGDTAIRYVKVNIPSLKLEKESEPFDPPIYPVDNKGNYNIFSLEVDLSEDDESPESSGDDNSPEGSENGELLVDSGDVELPEGSGDGELPEGSEDGNLKKSVLELNKPFSWTITLIGVDDSEMTSFLQETSIVQPVIKWHINEEEKENENTSNEQVDENENTSNERIIDVNKINAKIDFTSPYRIQYWHYDIYEHDTNILVYSSKKIFSQDISFSFDEFLNKTKYKIELHIMDTINQAWNDEMYITSIYDVLESSSNFTCRLLPFDSGVYLKWDNILSNISQSENGNSPDNISSIIETNNEGLTIAEQNVYNLNNNNALEISNLNVNTAGIYGCFKIAKWYEKEEADFCSFSVYDFSDSSENPKTQLKVFRTGETELKFITNAGEAIVTSSNDTWCCFYWHLQTGTLLLKEFKTSAENQPIKLTYEFIENKNNILTTGNYDTFELLTKQNITLPSASTVNKLTISGKGAQIAYVFAARHDKDEIKLDEKETKITDTSYWDSLNALNTQPYWNYGLASYVSSKDEIVWKNTELKDNCLFCLNFENREIVSDEEGFSFIEKNPYLVGDVAFKDKLSSFIIKRRKIGENYFKTIASVDISEDRLLDEFKLVDYSACSGEKYQYVVFPITAQKYQSPIYSPVINVSWDRWTLMICDEQETKENELILDRAFIFDLNIRSGAMQNNNKKTIIENFTPYPRVQSSPSCYWSGSLSGLLGYIAADLITYVQTPKMLDDFKNLSLSTKRKFLKDRDGNLFEVELAGQVSIDNTDNLIIDLKTKSLSWVEVADATDISIILREDSKKEWLLTEYGYSNPIIEYAWNDGQNWLNNHYWTSSERSMDKYKYANWDDGDNAKVVRDTLERRFKEVDTKMPKTFTITTANWNYDETSYVYYLDLAAIMPEFSYIISISEEGLEVTDDNKVYSDIQINKDIEVTYIA